MEIIYSPLHQRHDTTQIQARNTLYLTDETPERALRILQAIRAAGLGPVLPPEDYGDEPLLAVHTPELLDFLRSAYARQVAEYGLTTPVFPEVAPVRAVRNPSTPPIALAGIFSHGPDCPILAGTWEAAYWSAQCALTGANHLLNGQPTVYALCRPPGQRA